MSDTAILNAVLDHDGHGQLSAREVRLVLSAASCQRQLLLSSQVVSDACSAYWGKNYTAHAVNQVRKLFEAAIESMEKD